MKNHELLDMIGEVKADYVLAAGDNVEKPRFRWKTLAACAACAALVLGAYPVYRAVNPPLHGYTVMEGGTLNTLGDEKVPAQGADASAPNVPEGGEDSGGFDGIGYEVSGQDAPVQEKAAAQYDNLMKNGGINPAWPNPDWYGGAWIDNSYYPEAKLAVAVVDGFRTTELEAQIEEWCGGEVVFQDVKYALTYLYAFQDAVVDALTDGIDTLSCGIGVDVMENCLGVDIYSDGSPVPDAVLAKLAQLDPDGDAIRVRVFTGQTINTDIVKGPAPGGAQPEPNANAPADQEQLMPASVPGEIDELPGAKNDTILTGE